MSPGDGRLARAPVARHAVALDRTARATSRRETGGEEHPGPTALEHPVRGEGAAGRGVGWQRPGRRGGVREQRLPEIVPRDHRGHGVDAPVVPGQQQRQRPAVRPAGDAHPRVAGAVLDHLGACGQPVYQRTGVCDLEVRGVQRDLPAAGPEAARRPREDDEPAVDERARIRVDGRLRPTEAVRDQDGGRGRRGRQVEGGVEGDRAGQPGARGDLDLLLDGPGPRGGGRRRGSHQREQGRSEHRDREPGARRAGAGRGGGGHAGDRRAAHRQFRVWPSAASQRPLARCVRSP